MTKKVWFLVDNFETDRIPLPLSLYRLEKVRMREKLLLLSVYGSRLTDH
ncbi:hypothetical protein [Atribacter laminatus]|uniref:Uncharacterized protein n=1 Tax=Atribacter laminatus TaxID=2847778 RepID=A0A7T1AP20_ATRLM|nr:hypothetical protein [Atribacter laminatus]QPM69463.1 hypothetical protein RT761_02696 [Atribacter laminatus]